MLELAINPQAVVPDLAGWSEEDRESGSQFLALGGVIACPISPPSVPPPPSCPPGSPGIADVGAAPRASIPRTRSRPRASASPTAPRLPAPAPVQTAMSADGA